MFNPGEFRNRLRLMITDRRAEYARFLQPIETKDVIVHAVDIATEEES